MKKVRITAARAARYDDLIEKYENPIQHACSVREGQVFIANGWQRPEGFCGSAWESVSPFVMALAHGGGDFYDDYTVRYRSGLTPDRLIMSLCAANLCLGPLCGWRVCCC